MSNGGGGGAAPNHAQDLWNIVKAVNPYTQNPQLMLAQGIEIDGYGSINWYFRNAQLRVARSVRVPYCYPHPQNNAIIVLEHLLIGYEGSGGI